MLHQVVRRLEHCVSAEMVPGSDPELLLLTRMLTLAVSARSMLRERHFYLPGEFRFFQNFIVFRVYRVFNLVIGFNN